MLKLTRLATTLLGSAVALSGLTGAACPQAAATPPLELETKIPLGEVRGRIDHMAIDPNRNRLFVAELGNNSVGVVDLNDGRLLHVIPDLKEPQGVAYVASTDTLYVANAGDGTLRLYHGADFAGAGAIALGSDADNIRLDPTADRIFVGYGGGALAIIDATRQRQDAEIPLGAHPESFQLTPGGRRLYVNLPNARTIAVVDAATKKQIATWSTGSASGNFAMALDDAERRVITVFRKPPTLAAFSMKGGGLAASVETCADADDVFVDTKRQRIYVSCGDGFVDVFDKGSGIYRRAARIPTVPGARTSLFVAALDRLFVAVRANSGEPPAIWVFRPGP